ncbi:MAG: hypothetical protein SGJ13_13745, partial [Actinomycetota bacterium]|nr:hypothetical protein [Actinomycetota bacterium]
MTDRPYTVTVTNPDNDDDDDAHDTFAGALDAARSTAARRGYATCVATTPGHRDRLAGHVVVVEPDGTLTAARTRNNMTKRQKEHPVSTHDYRLIDAETNNDIGEATDSQIFASYDDPGRTTSPPASSWSTA